MSKRSTTYKILVNIFSRISKRRRFLLSSLILTLLMTVATFSSFDQAAIYLVLIVVATYIFTFTAILEGISDYEWLLLFIAPIYFTVVFYLFYFFLPQRWLTRLPFIIIYGVSIYAILLSQNIFNVGVTKSLQLFRAASSVNFLYLTVSAFLAYSLIISFRLDFWINFTLVMLSSIPLTLQFLWSVNPSEVLEKELVKYGLTIAFILGQAAAILSFIPIETAILALFLTACFYSLCGLLQAYLQDRLFIERIREYLLVMGFVLLIVILAMG